MYYITSLAKFGNHCRIVWAHRQGQWKGKNYSLSFPEEAGKKLCVPQCIFGRDFLSPHTTIVSGIKNYLSASMCDLQHCCQVLPGNLHVTLALVAAEDLNSEFSTPVLAAVDMAPILKLWPLYGAGSLPVASKTWRTWVTSCSLEREVPL